jgi:hypothetical protein
MIRRAYAPLARRFKSKPRAYAGGAARPKLCGGISEKL